MRVVALAVNQMKLIEKIQSQVQYWEFLDYHNIQLNVISKVCFHFYATKKEHILKKILFLDLFHKFGRIKDVQIVIDKKTNKSRGFGFVYFEEIESATRVRDEIHFN